MPESNLGAMRDGACSACAFGSKLEPLLERGGLVLSQLVFVQV
jgi:hypothetical protein